MNENEKINRVLFVMDVSNFEYLVIWAAFNNWKKLYPEDTFFIKPIEETDQDNLPDLLKVESFKRCLHKMTQSKLESLLWIAKNNHQYELDVADGIDVVFTEDDRLTNNFRKLKYPEYKAQRKLLKKQYDVFAIKNYIQDVIFKELQVETEMGYKIIKVNDCESDDIIAVLMKKFKNYMCRILVSSDRDFLQIEGINQYDFKGNKIERKVRNHEDFELDSKEFLLWKILKGDDADNIKNVFKGCGDVKSYKLVKDKPLLKQMLKENKEALDRYLLNRYLIDFRSIPEDVLNRISDEIDRKMAERSKKEEVEKFTLEGCLEL